MEVDGTAPSIEKRRHSEECHRSYDTSSPLATAVRIALLALTALRALLGQRSLHATLAIAEAWTNWWAQPASLLLPLETPLKTALESSLHTTLQARCLLHPRHLMHAVPTQLLWHLPRCALPPAPVALWLELPTLALMLSLPSFGAPCADHFARFLPFLWRDLSVSVGIDASAERLRAILLSGGSPRLGAAENDGDEATQNELSFLHFPPVSAEPSGAFSVPPRI